MSIKTICILFMVVGNVFAGISQQKSCDGFSPEAYNPTILYWDWTDQTPSNWTAYLNSGSVIQLQSPFEAPLSGQSQPNTEHLYLGWNSRDYLPEDGWELIVKHFGVGLGAGSGVDNPGFVLYNRFHGVLRFFMCVLQPDGSYTGAQIVTNFATEVESALLNNGVSISEGLNHFYKGLELKIPNEIKVEAGYTWLMADVPVAYDPCTCTKSWHGDVLKENISQINYSGHFIKQSSITAEFSEVLSDPDPVVQNGAAIKVGESTVFASIQNGIDFFTDVANHGNKVKENLSKSVSSVETFISNSVELSQTFSKEKDEFKFPAFFDAIPNIGFAFGVLEFFINGGKQTNKTNTNVVETPRNYALTGDMKEVGLMDEFTFYTPGSPHDNIIAQDGLKPTYDYVLGVFQLLETPKLEWAFYSPDGGIGLRNAILPGLFQFKLKKPLQYAINPASELEVVDFKVALEYTINPNKALAPKNCNTKHLVSTFWPVDTTHVYKTTINGVSASKEDMYFLLTGPVLVKEAPEGSTYLDRLEESGVYIHSWPTKNPDSDDPNGSSSMYNITYSTAFFNPNCWDNNSFLLPNFNGTIPVEKPPVEHRYVVADGYGNFYIRRRTILFPCIADAGLRFMDISSGKTYYDIKLKVQLVLRRTDAYADAETEDVVLIQTFDVDIDNASNLVDGVYNLNTIADMTDDRVYGVDYYVRSLSGDVPGLPYFNLGRADYPNTIILDQPTSFSNDTIIYANDSIYINAPVSATGGATVVFRAGEYIEANELLDAGLESSIDLEIGSATPCSGSEDIPAAMPLNHIIENICMNKRMYDPIFVQNKKTETGKAMRESFKKETSNTIHPWNAFPNPFDEIIQLVFHLETDALVSIRLLDIYGRVIAVHTDSQYQKSGEHNETLNTNTLAEGLYFLEVCIDQSCERKEVIKVIQ